MKLPIPVSRPKFFSSFSQQFGAKVSEKLEIFWIFHVYRQVQEQTIEKAIQLLATLLRGTT
jgi:hypothetical protein